MTEADHRDELSVNAVITALVARTQLGQVLERVADGSERFLIARRGEAAAVILGVDDFLRNVVRKPRLMARLAGQAAIAGASRMSLEQIQARIKEMSSRGRKA